MTTESGIMDEEDAMSRKFPLAGILISVLLLLSKADADTICLKNGRQMEGIIQEEGESQLILDVGFGTVTLQQAEIVRVEHSDEKEKEVLLQKQRAEYFETGRWIPEGAGELFERFKRVKGDREEALRATSKKEGLLAKQAGLESDIASLKQQHLPLAETLQTIDPNKETGRYNALVQQMNVLSATIQSRYLQLEETTKEVSQLDEAVHQYLNAFREFNRYARGEVERLRAGKVTEEDRAFYDGIDLAVAEMEEDFVQETVSSHRKGSHVLVDAVLNNKVTVSLVVDTGASLTVISKEVADRLGIDEAATLGEIDTVVADGRVVKAKAILLNSIVVGKARVERSMAAVLPTSESEVDGLLGMSFLKHFVVQVDGKNDLLILERLK